MADEVDAGSGGVARALVVGGGTMGRGIAQLLAQNGIDVRLADADAERTAAAVAAVGASLERAVGRARLTAAEGAAAAARVRPDDGRGDDALDLAIEAIVEDVGAKQALLGALDARLAPDAILASNTSSLSIATLGEGLPGRARLIGMHFFNPPVAMALIEIITAPATAAAVRERTVALARGLGKEPIVVRDSPGFATSRLGILLGLEAARMLEEGVGSAADIDRAMALGYGHPMGPLQLSDLVGLDVRLAIAEHLARELGPRFEPPAILRRLVAEGRLGKKSGRGFHDYGDA